MGNSDAPDESPAKLPSLWPHAPAHHLTETGAFLVTAGTYQKQHLFAGHERLKALHDGLLRYAAKHGWRLEAWAVFPNHYHFVGQAPAGARSAESLSELVADFHQHPAAWINQLDSIPGRKVWHNYWETRLTYEKSYLARLNYVHQNAVKHRVSHIANEYPWCSASWFELNSTPAQVQTVYGFKIDKVRVLDDF